MNVLSLFDGMSCGQIALNKLGVKVDKYYASEIDKYAIKVTQANFPNTIQLGDVTQLDTSSLPKIDLIMGGSPCQGFSFAGKQLAFDDPRSALFFEFIRLLKAIKPKYFLLENVRMKKEFLEIITEQVSQCYAPEDVDNQFLNVLGEVRFEPIFINSSLLSAQSRQRYYWTNISGIKQPEDRGIVLRDILETEPENFTKMSDKFVNDQSGKPMNKPIKIAGEKGNHYGGGLFDTKGKSPTLNGIGNGGGGTNNIPKVLAKNKEQMIETKPKQVGIAVDIKGHDQIKRVYSPDGKSPTVTTCGGGHREPKVVTGGAIRGRAYDKDGKRMDKDGVSVANKTTQMLELRKDDKSNAITTVGKDSVAVNEDLTWRKLTPLECERLQTVPDNYTNHVSNTQRYKMLGNGWTVKVICHILKNMEGYQNKSNGRVDVGEFSDTQP